MGARGNSGVILSQILRGLADTLGIACASVLSIGDHFVNDIEPALAAGCTTAYVDPFGVGPRGKASLEGARFEELVEPIEEWLDARLAASVPASAGTR
jgi:FMN phosphatase YigB (HAD superfamily)